jgi:N-acetylneuraminic acid mutarotase
MQKLLTLLFIVASVFSKADSWTQKASFGGTARVGVAVFSIANKGYIGLGTDSYPSYNFRNDLWEYDESTDTWTQKANFPGAARYGTLNFSIGTKGYLGSGWNGSYFNDFWQYDQQLNNWTQKGNFPGVAREGGFSFVINNIAYAGFGVSSSSFLNDFYCYNDTSDTWTQVATCPSAARCGSFAFVVNGKGYMGAGAISNYGFVNDVWQYDPVLDTWTQKANFPGLPRTSLGYFQINNIGYAGGGVVIYTGNTFTYYKDFYEYNAAINTWTQKADIPIAGDYYGGFALNNSGYLGTGNDSEQILSNRFFQYNPDSTTNIQEISNYNFSVDIFPNPVTDKLNVSLNSNDLSEIILYDITSRKLLQQTFTNAVTLNISHLSKGIYIYEVRNNQGVIKKAKLMKE